jgi:MoaA/NifB/PqqE/SkfB family radical SAM enzyme
MCQSNCKTCYIGREYKKNPQEIKKRELSLDEIEKFFKSLGSIYFFNISGGEPYLRDDLSEIVDLALNHLKPKIIHIPTNAFLPEKIEKTTRTMLSIIEKYNHHIPLTVKPSVDGIGKKHDEIRGLKGNFERLEETIHRLKGIERDYANLHVELGTVVSNFNINDLDEIEDWVHRQGVQSYRNEIAEQREEFFNIGEEITPSVEVYEELMARFKNKIMENLNNKNSLTKMAESLRFVYYDLATRILKEKRQVIPCYAGISNIHLNYDGDIWPCCVLGYAHSMGNIRDFNHSYKDLCNSKKAKDVRDYIKNGNCWCPLANQAYSNIVLNFSYFIKVFLEYIEFQTVKLVKKKKTSLFSLKHVPQ